MALLTTLLLSTALAAAPGRPDAYGIYERAREVWLTQRYPDVLAYTVEVTAANDGTPAQRHYHEFWSAADGRVFVNPPVSDEQVQNPYKPSPGVSFMGWNIGAPREGSGVKDFISVPLLAPNYSFGLVPYIPPSALTPADLVAQIRREYHDPSPAKIAQLEQTSGLKTIASVTSSAGSYKIELVGVEPEQTGPAYHLALTPLRDPLKYRLRDLWIDKATFETDRARIGGNFTDAATESVSWMVRFEQIDGTTYIQSERAESPIVGYHGLMYTQYQVAFQSVRQGTLPRLADLSVVDEPLCEP